MTAAQAEPHGDPEPHGRPEPRRNPDSRRKLRIGRVVVLAEDLIWASRLTSLVESAGAEAKHTKTALELERELVWADGAIIDLTARSYDPVAAIERSHEADREVICVGPHEDVALRRRAFAAGAARVMTYNQVHTHGPTLIGGWLSGE